ncbi:LPS export ABC transporter periplasmic protein LptC [Actibacterium lipolyticum]|uniref:LPS export ABC transporter periplasmic protein LptC n=1 Tax=Actibacterium lipolyticum TaxID=1524263 RepID=A0A238KVT1_9RHOB|nr:LPS export ABC transporter periplasmic protein LptC [Actibacterium lipolyticum]SMX46807.1 hypothetical protein COL8621_03256 [Actibacterium lipolyticum]
MASFDNTYSRFIALAKIVLPLAALALLSTLFLFSRDVDPTRSIPYSNVDVEQLVREQRVNAPHYSGVTSDGTAISVSAESAIPELGNPERASATAMTARLDFANGGHTDIQSASGQIDTGAGNAVLDGGVIIDTSDGYHITTNKLTTALDQTSVVTDSTINATGPLGTLTAGQMELNQTNGENGGYLLVFKQGVKLVYDPAEQGELE